MPLGNGKPSEATELSLPINEEKLSQLQHSIGELSSQQLAWVSGYLWGMSQANSGELSQSQFPTAESESVVTSDKKLTIIFASQTGNAKGVAEALEKQAVSLGISTNLLDASDVKGKSLAKLSHLIVVASTNGEGEAPDNALELHEFLQSKKAPKLDKLQYGVIGLGDSSYEFFCQTGKDFDAFLSKLGAQSFIDRVDCDVDYDAPVEEWTAQALSVVQEQLAVQPADVVQLPVNQSTSTVEYSKHNPYQATLLTNQKITGRDSSKDVRHIEIDLEDSGITYQPGDSLGVWYENSSKLANDILSQVGLSGVESVEVDGESLSIHSALVRHYEITAANPQFVDKYAQVSESKKLLKLTENKAALREYSSKTQIIDVLATKKTKLSAQQLVLMLRRLTPRLYSIASSQAEVEEEVHLTVGVVEYAHGGDIRQGGASGYLSQRLEEGGDVRVFVEANNHFKLPESDDTPIIMIGPGTGIAPFRSFLQERESRDATGANWLFFGDRSFTQDFLYQSEWQRALKSGLLTKLDVAFSRDQEQKVYVQHRLLEQAEEVWRWIDSGAHIYICGDADQMAKDVHQALVDIAVEQGGLSEEQAQTFFNDLRKNKRYQKDVY
ncbi:assimilatory sulfite reductase (NADPH) flavoprotein subunit [Vibrio sinus]|uniref:assimilatory sulfite reductase (NADPH) flavoprotein subunit n=1 Tax=Vibrio sinus TaxID=2946865 RepID=UPI003D6EB54F